MFLKLSFHRMLSTTKKRIIHRIHNACCKGITLNQLDNRLSMKERTDLRQYADLYHLMEDFVKRANQAGFVFQIFVR